MTLPLITEYPFWYIIFCVTLGVAYSFVLYFKNKKFRFGKTLSWFLAFLRAITIAAIAFLLLKPYIKSEKEFIEKPIIIFSQDNSQSILNSDSLYYTNEYLNEIKVFQSELSQKYNVKNISFGSKILNNDSITFRDGETNFSQLFNEINTSHHDKDIRAMIIASDGNYNQGIHPLYATKNISYPIHTIALGNPEKTKDIAILKINHNQLAYLNNEFPIEIMWTASMLQEKSTVLNIYHKNKKIKSLPLKIKSDAASGTEKIYLKADKPGLKEYSVEIKSLDEKNTHNNQRKIFIEVINDASKVLIIGHAPHPDIKALKSALDNNIRYSVETAFLNDFDKNILDYNLIILHQTPSNTKKSATLLAQIYGAEIPVLHIIGSQTDIKFLNALKTGQKIENINNSYNQPTANVNEQFTLFTLSESTKSWIKNTPPLTVPFGDYSVAPSLNTLLFQQIGNIKTQKPLITLSGNGNKKTGIINGTGIWKWRMQDYIDNNNHEHFNSFISKIVQYLSIRKEKGRFRIEHNKTYLQSEQAVFYAELYNKSYKLINDSDVSIHLYKSDSIDYEFTFDKTDKKYRLDAGNLPEGIYSFVATTKQGGKTFSKTGKFVVSAIRKEQLNTTANHKLLKQLAEQNDGEMHRVNEISKLKDLLLNTNAQPVVYNDKSYNLLLNNSWALILIIFTLSLEWFLRKYNGGY